MINYTLIHSIGKMTRYIAIILFFMAFNAVAQTVYVVDHDCGDGWIYTGQMTNGKRHGQGEAVSKRGNTYGGLWVNGLLPRGIMHVMGENESIYEGSFNTGFEPDGFGIMRYLAGKRKGDVYAGNFEKGFKQGIGKYTYKDGKIEFGRWLRGVIVVPKGKKYTVGKRVYGLDLSHHNKVDWDQLAVYCNASGDAYKIAPPTKQYLQPVFFVYARATAGATVVDSLYKQHAFEARNHAVPFGSYHVLSFTTSTVDEQLANFLAVTDSCAYDELPMMLDVEHLTQAKQAGARKVMAMVLDFLVKVEKATGRRPIIYTNDKFDNLYLDMNKLKKYTIWKASYGKKSTQEKKKPQSPWQIWQFTEWGVTPAISPVDINIYDGDYHDFSRKYIRK